MLYYYCVCALFITFHFLAGVAVHEAGHLVFGLATGYRFSSFRLFFLVWSKQEGKLRLQRDRNRLLAGQCLMAPPAGEKGFRFVLYNAGGGLANLALGALWVAGLLLARNGWAVLFFVLGAAANFGMALLNLLPLEINIPNDGMNIAMARKSPAARHGMYMMLKVNEEVLAGKRYREYSSADFCTQGISDMGNYFESYPLLLEAARLLDLQRNEEAMALYGKLPLDRMARHYASAVRADQLYDAIVRCGNYVLAEALCRDKGVRHFLRMGTVGTQRIQAAKLFFVDGRRQEGERMLAAACAALPHVPSLGVRAMEAEELERLGAAMRTARVEGPAPGEQ